jgi:hypothetical protein
MTDRATHKSEGADMAAQKKLKKGKKAKKITTLKKVVE